MKISVPNQIQIGCHKYNIYFDSELSDDNYWGAVNYKHMEILINPIRKDSQRMSSFFHECLHIIKNVYGQRSENITEDLVDQLSEGFSQVICELGIELDWSNITEKE